MCYPLSVSCSFSSKFDGILTMTMFHSQKYTLQKDLLLQRATRLVADFFKENKFE